MKWHREGSVIHVELDASDFPEHPVLTWDLPYGVRALTDEDGRLTSTRMDIPA